MSHESERARSEAPFNLANLASQGLIALDWAEALTPVQAELEALGDALAAERAQGAIILPDEDNIMRAFQRPLSDVRVLILGQDPYPTIGHPIGLAFACDAHVRPLPRSLTNIFRELSDDLGELPQANGDLTGWAKHGVMLLNRVLTVRAGQPGSHRGLGWETVTDCAIHALVERDAPLVSVLWGKDAQTLAPRLERFPVVSSPHPSPLSARRGFFGSRPFSRVNELLALQQSPPIDWQSGFSAEAML